MPTLSRAAGVLAGLAGACVAYGTFVERRWYRCGRVPLPGALRDPEAERLTVLHVSDVHLDPPQDHKVRFVRGLAEQDYDLVVLTGDLLGARDSEPATVELMAHLTAGGVPGVAVLGSNDLYGPVAKGYHRYVLDPDERIVGEPLDTERLAGGLEDAGYRVLRGERTVVETARGPVAVGGIHDPHLQETVLPPLAAVAAREDTEAVAFLGLVHAPYTAALDLLIEGGYDLLLAGHTHGGQVRLPVVGAVVGNCDLPLDQIRGASRYRGAWLHVSPGLGTSRYAPFRFLCPPEATLLELT